MATPKRPATQLHTIPEAAAILRCSRGHIYTLIADGDLDTVDIAPRGHATKMRIPDDSITAYIADRRTNAKRLHAVG